MIYVILIKKTQFQINYRTLKTTPHIFLSFTGLKVEEFNDLLNGSILEEYERHRVLLALEEKPNSVKDIAAEINVDPSVVLEHMLILKSRMLVDFKEIVGITPIYMRT